MAKMKRKTKKKKPVMYIYMTSKFLTHNNKYCVEYGRTEAEVYKNKEYFVNRKPALKRVRALKKKFTPEYKIEYHYMAD